MYMYNSVRPSNGTGILCPHAYLCRKYVLCYEAHETKRFSIKQGI